MHYGKWRGDANQGYTIEDRQQADLMTVTTSISQGLILVAVGAMMLVVFVWSRRGRSRAARWWVLGTLASGTAMGALPGGGLFIATTGLIITFGNRMPDFLGVLIALVLVLCVPFTIVGIVFPRLWAPEWYKKIHNELHDKGRC